MMNVKMGTQTFGKTQERPVSENTIAQTMSATDREKINGDNVGDALNKITDPNWVDPSKKMRAVGNDKLDKEAFFKLMLTQMKNQDPTNPLKSHEMAAQLASFSSLEQMSNINTTLTDLKNGQKPLEQYQALALIGKSVAGDSSKLIRNKGDMDHDFRFSLPSDASEVSVQLKNKEGEVVRKFELRNLKKGDNSITWNGRDERDISSPAGEYTFAVDATATNGSKVAVKTDFEGQITGMNYTSEGPVLMVGSQTIRLRDVKRIIDPSLMKNDQKPQAAVSQDLKVPSALLQTDPRVQEGAPEAAPSNTMALENVGMSRELTNKLQKETK